MDDTENEKPLLLSREQVRAALLVKLVQILKLKKNAQKSTVAFMLAVLNQQPAEEGKAALTISDGGVEFFDCVTQLLNAAGVRLSEKEHFVMEGQAHVV